MTQFLKKHIFSFLLLSLFLVPRIFFLLRLPIFNDESIYLRWGQVFHDNPKNWALPIPLDGKQPGLSMLFGLLQYLPVDPLASGRLLSVAFSCFTFFGIIWLAGRITKSRIWILVLTLFLSFCPYTFFFETKALMESAVMMIHVLSLVFFIQFIEHPTTKKGMHIGLLLAFGWWIKSTILITGLCIVVGLLIASKGKKQHLMLYGKKLFGGMVLFFLGIMPILSHKDYFQIVSRQSRWLLTLPEILQFPFAVWWKNTLQGMQWFFAYLTPVVFFFAIFSLVKLEKKKDGIYMLLWICMPFFITIAIARIFTSRYVVLIAPLLVLIAWETMLAIRQKKIQKIFVVIAFLWAFLTTMCMGGLPLVSYEIFALVPAAHADFKQYVVSWPSGYGVKEAVSYLLALQDKAKGKMIVIVRSDSGNPEDAIYLYASRAGIPVFFADEFVKKSDVLIKKFGPAIFFVSRGNKFDVFGPYLEELVRFKKPLDDEFIGVYKLRV